MSATVGTDQLTGLRHKYDPVVRLMHQTGARVQNVEMQGDKLLLRAEAPSDDVKNKIWDEIKRIDPAYQDLKVEITVVAGAAGQGGPVGTTAPSSSYTVKKGDTLSKISQEFYGKASDFRRIFDANRDQLKDPDEIRPGQVLRIPAK